MKINISHTRDSLVGWDIDVSVLAEAAETIGYVEVRVNDFPEVKDNLSSPLSSWDEQITQKGVYPGNNKVEVLVRDQDSQETRALQRWS